MDKKQLKLELSRYANNSAMISPRKVREFTGFGSAKVSELLQGLDRIKDDNGEKFFITDVAERIMERTVRA